LKHLYRHVYFRNVYIVNAIYQTGVMYFCVYLFFRFTTNSIDLLWVIYMH